VPVKNIRGGKEENMGSKQKQTHLGRKVHFERKLEERLAFLLKKEIEFPMVDRDTLVKKLRAHIRAINARLEAIGANERKTEELAKIKADKEAAFAKAEGSVKGKKVKDVPEEGKVKKKKPEKTESSAKEEEGGKVEKAKAVSEEGKEKKKKKVKEETGEPAQPSVQVKQVNEDK
jgi:hypothetical protein